MTRFLCALLLLPSVTALGQPGAELIAIARHVELTPDDALERYRAFTEKHATDEWGDLARVLAGAHLLAQLGRYADPAPVPAWLDDKPKIRREPTPLDKPIAELEKSLWAHVGMLRLARALRHYHRRHVEFPETLEALVERKLIDAGALTDPFGQRYVYQPQAPVSAPDLPRQDFSLRCASLGVDHRQLPAVYEDLRRPEKNVELRRVESDGVFAAGRRPDGVMGASRQWRIGQEQYGYTLALVFDGAAVVTRGGLPRILTVRER